MLPYIGLLIVIIVAVLLTVYKQEEYFTMNVSSITITSQTNAREVETFGLKLIQMIKGFNTRLTALGKIPVNYSPSQRSMLDPLKEGGAASQFTSLPTTTDDLKKLIDNTFGIFEMTYTNMKKGLDDKRVDLGNSTVADVIKAIAPPNVTPSTVQIERAVTELNNNIISVLPQIKALDEVIGALEVPPVSDTPGSTGSTGTSGTGSTGTTGTGSTGTTGTGSTGTTGSTQYRFDYNTPHSAHRSSSYSNDGMAKKEVVLNVDDLVAAFGPLSNEINASKDKKPKLAASPVVSNMTTSKVKPVTDSAAAPVASQVNLSDETINRLSKSLASQMNQKKYQTQTMYNPQEDMESATCEESDANEQGIEHTESRPHPGFDKNQYIRKDSIPCWGCTLPA